MADAARPQFRADRPGIPVGEARDPRVRVKAVTGAGRTRLLAKIPAAAAFCLEVKLQAIARGSRRIAQHTFWVTGDPAPPEKLSVPARSVVGSLRGCRVACWWEHGELALAVRGAPDEDVSWSGTFLVDEFL